MSKKLDSAKTLENTLPFKCYQKVVATVRCCNESDGLGANFSNALPTYES